MSTPPTSAAIASVLVLARELGLPPVGEPIVLADRSNLVLRLAPHPIVARVAMATSMVRVGMTWLRREVEVSRFLAARGAHVTTPTEVIEPGPFERDGLVISFWKLEALADPPPDPTLAGARLVFIHRALRELPTAQLPEWGGWLEARGVLDRARTSRSMSPHEQRALERGWDEGERIVASARARSTSFQAVHGDAHIHNVLSTDRGPVWTDFEDAFVGPVEWDLACLRSRAELFGEDRDAIEAACAGYGPYDPALVADLALVRNLQVIPWLAVFAERHPELIDRMRARIARLPTG